MLFSFGDYELDIDVERTRQFYQTSAQMLTEGCDCAGCRNFRAAYPQLPDPVKTFLEMLGADIVMAPEMAVYNGDRNKGTLFYNGFLHLCGTIRKDGAVRTREAPNRVHIEKESWYTVAEGCSVMFTGDCALLEKDFPTPVIQMEICLDAPWVLEGETYEYWT